MSTTMEHASYLAPLAGLSVSSRTRDALVARLHWIWSTDKPRAELRAVYDAAVALLDRPERAELERAVWALLPGPPRGR